MEMEDEVANSFDVKVFFPKAPTTSQLHNCFMSIGQGGDFQTALTKFRQAEARLLNLKRYR